MNLSQAAEPSAVVVGACAHSLAVIRSLARAGINVHVVEADASLPGFRTRYGTKHLVDDINGPALIDALIALRTRLPDTRKPVLFLSNDRMVRTVAASAARLAECYALSWADSAATVSSFTDKLSIEQRCRDVGLDYPATLVIDSANDLSHLAAAIEWPRIIKPARPLSGFKVMVAGSGAEAVAMLAPHAADFPVLLQRWVPGDDTSIHFTAFYLDRGVPIARFDGRKLRSYPMGHTTVAEPPHNDLVFRCASRFFAGTGVSGPASLEVKMDPSGRPWVIEPTVGRTDFWVDLCIANGIDLPMIEYRHQTGARAVPCQQADRAVWLNAERDRIALPWYLRNLHRASRPLRRLRFTFLAADDRVPFWVAMRGLLKEAPSLLRRALPFRAARRART